MSNDKQTTALQQLRWFISDGLENYDESIKVSEIWAKINELLPIERQQIEDAYKEGMEFIPVDLSKYESDAKEYFESTFTQ